MWHNINKYLVTNTNYGESGITIDNNYMLIIFKTVTDIYCDECPNNKHMRYSLAGLHIDALMKYNLRHLSNIADAYNNPTLITPSTRGVVYVNKPTNPRTVKEDVVVLRMSDGNTKAWLNPKSHYCT